MNSDFLLGRRRWEKRMDAELRFHLENQIADYVKSGVSREDAELRARREFGAMELTKDECRDQRSGQWLDQCLRDIRHAFRALRKNPGFAMATIMTFALGIGANAAIFSVIYAVLLKPLPFSQPDQIYSVEVVVPERRSQFASLPVTVQSYLEWRAANTVFDAMAAMTPAEWNLTGDGEPERMGGALVSANFFSFLGIPIAKGRGFLPEEEQPGRDKVVVISDSLWHRRYGSDSAIVGKHIQMNGESHLVVGIALPSLLVPVGTQMHPLLNFAPKVEMWKPISATPREMKNESWNHGLLVRLKQEGDLNRGRQQLDTILNDLIRTQMPGIKVEVMTQFVPIREVYSGKIRQRLLLILGASALLLLIACTNIAICFSRESPAGQPSSQPVSPWAPEERESLDNLVPRPQCSRCWVGPWESQWLVMGYISWLPLVLLK